MKFVVVGLSFVGCAALLGPGPEEVEATLKPARELVEKKQYLEAAQVLKTAKLPVRNFKNQLTPYGELCDQVVSLAALKPVEAARRDPSPEADAAALAGLDAIKGLPLAELSSNARPEALDKARAAVTTRITERAAVAERQLSALREDAKGPFTSVALAQWLAFIPTSKALEAEQEEALFTLSKRLHLERQVKVALVPAAGAHVTTQRAVESIVRSGGLAGIEFVPEAQANVTLVVSGGAPKLRPSKGSVTLEHKYPTGRREVANPDYARRQERIADLDKKAASARKQYDSTNCGRGGSVRGRTKFPGGDCAKAYYQAWERASKDAEAERKNLSRTKPTKQETVYSSHSYQAQEDKLVVEQAFGLEYRYQDKRAGKQQTLPVTDEFLAYTHGPNPSVQLKARAQRLPPQDIIDQQLSGSRTGKLRAVLSALSKDEAGQLLKSLPAGPANEAERLLRTSSTPGRSFEQSEANRAARALDAIIEKRLGRPFKPLPEVQRITFMGIEAMEWTRFTELGEAEEAAQRPLVALLAWGLATPPGPTRTAQREAKLAALKDAALASARLGLATSGEPESLVARVQATLPALAAAPAGGAPELSLELKAARPTIKRVKQAAFAMVQEVKRGEEEEPNPRYESLLAIIQNPRADIMEQMLARAFIDMEKPTRLVPVIDPVPYKADREAASLTGEVQVKLSGPAATAGATLTIPVTLEREAFSHPARAETGLEARAEKLPTDEELVAAWEAEAASAVFEATIRRAGASAAEGLGPELERQLFTIIRGARRVYTIGESPDGTIREGESLINRTFHAGLLTRFSADRTLKTLFPDFYAANSREPRR